MPQAQKEKHTMSNMIRKSLDPEGTHDSPQDLQNRVDNAYDNIKVRLLWAPYDKEGFDRLVYKAVLATRGSSIEANEVDPKVVEEAFSGGLNQCLEWVNVVFEISGVTRGLTHELVRTRKASFAQQSMRHTNMGFPAMRMPEEIAAATEMAQLFWEHSVLESAEIYQWLVENDYPFQDARTVLPIATETYIVAAYPLKVFMDTYAYRACSMFYPEIVWLFREMKRVLVEACPWLEPFIKISCEKTRPTLQHEHMCTYQGWEQVEGHCPFAWALEDNRVWKSTVFKE